MINLSDLKYALRLLGKRPGFTALTTMVMATGIGLSVYLLVFFNTALFKDLPFEDGGSLMQVSASFNGINENNTLSVHDYHQIRTNVRGMKEFSAYSNTSVNVAGRDGARRYAAAYAEPNIFQLTRTKPLIGREFTDAENLVGAENVVVIGYDAWQNQFGGSEEALGQMLRINGESHRVIGVMPEGYFFPTIAEMWIPMRRDATKLPRGEGGSLYGLAHLEEGVTKDDINRQLNVIMQRLEQQYPKTNNGIGAYTDSLTTSVAAGGIAVVRSMQVTAILILLLAAINVGNLLFSRAVERGKETAIRVALGAPRSRLISQMVWESVIICTVGGIIGLCLMAWGLEITQGITDGFSYGRQVFWWQYGVDAYAIKLVIAFIIATILMTGLLPAWKNSDSDFNAVLRDGTRGALGKKAGRLNRLLVISEIFVSMAILIAAGVVVVASYNRTHEYNGANPEGILTGAILLPETAYDTPEKQAQFAQTLQSRLENAGSIGDVMMATALPGMATMKPSIALEGKVYDEKGGNSYPRANYIAVTPGSLAKLDITLRDGRYFSSVDDGLAKTSVLVSDSFATRHFPDTSAIGKRIRIAEFDGAEPTWLTIVGVVEHTIHGDDKKLPTVFRPFTQAPRLGFTLAAQMKSDTASAIQTMRRVLKSIDPDLPAYRIETYEDKISRFSAPIRFISSVFMLFAGAAVILAASGIYGVMSNTISQRTQEIGVKQALGAKEERITREFLMVGFKQLLWGGIPGLIGGSAMGFAMAQVFGLEGAAIAGIAVLMVSVIGSVVMVAAYVPTKRALQMEPSEALRYE